METARQPDGRARLGTQRNRLYRGHPERKVRLTLAGGASLPDPQRLFNAMLNGKSRARDIYEGDELNEAALKALISAVVERNMAKVKPGRASMR